MKKIEILDCTLRDGGYINTWQFGDSNIKKIYNALKDTGVDYIECGFLNNKKLEYDENATIFNQFDKLDLKKQNTEIALMVLIKELDIEKLNMCTSNNWNIRLSFHKDELYKAIEYGLKIKEKGYKLFFQPTVIMSYNDEEIENIIDICNNILKPDVVGIVDTIGQMLPNDVKRITKLFDNNLDSDIKLLFHGHNTLQMAFSNAMEFINNVDKRNIIIDSTVMGMGRDAGNLCTELIINYLNLYYGCNYNTNEILKLLDEVMLDVNLKYKWGYSPYYMLNAKLKTHPRYAKFFKEKITNISLIDLEKILENIQIDERYAFNINEANKLVKEFVGGKI